MAFIGWFVDWDDSVPLHYIWSDLDTRHCTYWMWRYRLAGWFVCPIKGHGAWYADHCGRPAHDICSRCNDRRDRVEVCR
jgi:hypothetical protein